MPPPDRIADLIIAREAYRVCPLMPQREFLSFCRDRNIKVSHERLRKLERLKLFYPVLRIYRIDVTHKIELLDGGARYRDLGELKENETWTGNTQAELAGFDFSARVVRSWQENENAWDPRAFASLRPARRRWPPFRKRSAISSAAMRAPRENPPRFGRLLSTTATDPTSECEIGGRSCSVGASGAKLESNPGKVNYDVADVRVRHA
jgi:hypothetical protein